MTNNGLIINEQDYETVQDESFIVTDKPRWVRIVLLFAICLAAYVVGGLGNRPQPILITCGAVMVAGLLMLQTWELLILVYLLSAIDHLPLWLSPGMSTFSEPVLLKLVKDILGMGLLFATFKIRPIINRKFLVTYILFGTYLFLRAAVQPGAIGLTMVYLRYYLFYPFLGVMFMGALDSIDKFTRFFRIAVFAGTVVVLVGLFEIITNHKTYYSGYVNFGPVQQRMVSTLGNPNNLGFFLQLPLLYLMSGLFLKVGRTSLLFAGLLILAIGMFFTFSRTAFVMVGVGALCIAIMLKNFRAVAIAVFLLAVGAVALFFVYGGRGKVNILGSRVDALVRFVAESAESPQIFILGRGLGSVEMVERPGEEVLGVAAVTDNAYTDLLRTTGIIGMTLFIIFWSCLALMCRRVGQQIVSMRGRRLYLTLMTWNIIYALYGFAGPSFSLYPTALIYWISVFWILALPELEAFSGEEILSYADYETENY